MPLNLPAVAVSVTGVYDRAGALERPASNIAINLARAFADGGGAGQASVLYTASRTLASGANESLDLNGTALLDSFGTALALTKIMGILIQARDANTTNLTIANVANGVSTIFGTTYSLVLQPGEFLAKVTNSNAGYVVTPTTADLLNIANAAGAAATYDIVLIGAP
jgi:hypothetical protein